MDQLTLKTCTVDLRALRVVHRDGGVVALSAREAEVLVFLAERPHRTVDRDTLYAEVWGYRNAALSRAVDAMVRRLRTKIEDDPSEPTHLLTVHGEGYRFEPCGTAEAAAPDGATLVAVGRDPLESADASTVSGWIGRIDRSAAKAGGAPLGRRGDDAVWSFAAPAPAVAFCLAAVDDGATVGARGAAIGTDDRVRLRRMIAAVSPGRVVLSDELYAEVALATGIRERVWRRLGGVRLTLDADPERLVETGGTVHDPGLRGVEGNLPAAANRTIGRSSDLSAALERLRHGRLVTLTGTGGVGKTRLSLEVGVAWRARGGGAWFCDLSACRTAREVESAVARALAVPLAPGRDLAQILGHLAGDLVVFDNAEQALEAVREPVARWAALERGPSLLVTSRERLGIPEEEVQELLPLGPDDGVALFRERTRALGLTVSDEPAVRALVERIDGLPLAIELAAARSEVVSPVELLARLERSLYALGRDPARTPRHADLRATVRWSWELLDPLERRVLAACCAFAGPFEAAAAVAVTADEAHDDVVLEALHALRRKGLLTSVAAGQGPRRLLAYAAVRAFAAEQAEPDALLALRDRHARWFAQWGRPATEDTLASASGEALLARMVLDLPDLVSAVDHAASRDPQAAVGAFLGAAHVLAMVGPFEEVEALAQRILPLGLEVARVQAARVGEGASEAVLREVDRALEAWPDDGRALQTRAEIANQMDWVDGARERVERAIELLRSSGDTFGLGRAVRTRCDLLARFGAWSEMGDMLVEALAAARRRGDRSAEVHALQFLALVSCRTGSFDQALEEARAAHSLGQGTLDPGPRISAGNVLSAIHRMRDEPAPAMRIGLATLTEARRVGARAAAHTSQIHLALLACEYRSARETRHWVAAARSSERELGISADLLAAGWLATAELADGQVPEAIAMLGQAIDGLRATGADPFVCQFLALRAAARAAGDDLVGARADLDAVFETMARRDLGRSIPFLAFAERAVVRARSGDPVGAAADLAAAESQTDQTGLLRTKGLLCRGLVALAGGDREEAARVAGLVRAEVDRRGLGPTTALGARLAAFERALAST